MNDRGGVPLVKLYYRIGEVADIVGVETHTLRYWEKGIRSLRPQKSRTGHRIYSRREVEKLLRVKELLYAQGFTLAGARRRLREEAAQASQPRPERQAEQLRAALESVRRDVVELLETLEPPSAAAEGHRSRTDAG
ncbi:MAG: MerR family transcriptional regulator [Polyangiaceae bacterium]|nr:MerR family transcriptional regulator [Polyangiaceae bacterium]